MKNFNNFHIIAHRGSPSEFPENTIESFNRAVEIDKNCMLELDVWESSDGAIVVMHDELLDSKTNGQGPVTNMALNELKKLDAGYNVSFDNGNSFPFRDKSYKIPLLDQVLLQFPKNMMSVDIKHDSISFANSVIELIKKHNSVNRIVVGSFHNKIISWIRKNHPDIITAFSKKEIVKFLLFQRLNLMKFYKPKDKILSLPEFVNIFLNKKFRIVTRKFIKEANKISIPVYVWTVNNTEDMKRLIEWGVIGIITDYPDKLKRIISENSSKQLLK